MWESRTIRIMLDCSCLSFFPVLRSAHHVKELSGSYKVYTLMEGERVGIAKVKKKTQNAYVHVRMVLY